MIDDAFVELACGASRLTLFEGLLMVGDGVAQQLYDGERVVTLSL